MHFAESLAGILRLILWLLELSGEKPPESTQLFILESNTSENERPEPKKSPLSEKENHLNQTSMFGGSMLLIFQGVSHFVGKNPLKDVSSVCEKSTSDTEKSLHGKGNVMLERFLCIGIILC